MRRSHDNKVMRTFDTKHVLLCNSRRNRIAVHRSKRHRWNTERYRKIAHNCQKKPWLAWSRSC